MRGADQCPRLTVTLKKHLSGLFGLLGIPVSYTHLTLPTKD